MEHAEDIAEKVVESIREHSSTAGDTITATEELTDFVICKKLVQLHQSANSRSLEFNLTFKTVKKLLLRKRCYYTNVIMTADGPMGRSIDRVDSSLGYIEGNVVACTVDINSKKGHLTVCEILQLAKNLEKHAKNRKTT